jgi:hypothetical protein
MGGTCSAHRGYEKCVQSLVGKPKGKRPLGINICISEDNIKICVGWEVVEWIHIVQNSDRWWTLVNTVMNLRISCKAQYFFISKCF